MSGPISFERAAHFTDHLKKLKIRHTLRHTLHTQRISFPDHNIQLYLSNPPTDAGE